MVQPKEMVTSLWSELKFCKNLFLIITNFSILWYDKNKQTKQFSSEVFLCGFLASDLLHSLFDTELQGMMLPVKLAPGTRKGYIDLQYVILLDGAPILANTVHFLKLRPRRHTILHLVQTFSRFGAPSDSAVLRLGIWKNTHGGNASFDWTEHISFKNLSLPAVRESIPLCHHCYTPLTPLHIT